MRSASDVVANETSAKSFVGSFFEDVAGAVLGTELWPQRYGIHDGSFVFNPDLLDRANAGFVEVKACRRGFKYHVACAQLHAYERAQHRDDVPVPRPRVTYMFVTYDVDRKLGKFRRLGELVDALAAGIEYAVAMDVELVRVLADRWGKSKGYVTPLSDMLGKWDELYRLTAARLRPFSLDPEAALLSVGEDVARWNVERLDGGVGVEVDVSPAWPGTVVRPFPVARISQRRPACRWDGPLRGEPETLFGSESLGEPLW